jgi:hypothetical protein
MVVPLWEIGRSRQLLSCKEMEINQTRTLGWEGRSEGLPVLGQMSMAARRGAQSG